MGNTPFHARRSSDLTNESPGEEGVSAFPIARSPGTPGSPLTYSPQVPMEPLTGEVNISQEYLSAVGIPAQPKLLPTVIVWSHGGSTVEVQGSFDNWSSRQPLQRSGKDWTLIKLLPPGVYQYKFVVDGKWRHDPHQPSMLDELGNINNYIEVQEYVPENLDGLTGFDPPPSPQASYINSTPSNEEYAKAPPQLPAHLQLTLLNVPPAMDAQAVLPRPLHVILNHIYDQPRYSAGQDAMVLGVTHRYKSKYVTVVMYKPRRQLRGAKGGASAANSGPGAPPSPQVQPPGRPTSSTNIQ